MPAAGEFPFFLAGKPSRSDQPIDVLNPFDGSRVGRTRGLPGRPSSTALLMRLSPRPPARDLPTYERAAILSRVSAMLAQRRDALARIVAGEVGKPIRDALTETDRTALTAAARIVTGCSPSICSISGVIINDVPTWRMDHMPYGGVKVRATPSRI